MLTISLENEKSAGRSSPFCCRVLRRNFLRIGTLSLGTVSLPDLLAVRSAEKSSSVVRNRSVVLVYLSGGASHIETFDPKMTAPAEVRSMTGEIATKISGVTFGGTFPGLAARADKLAVVRTHQHSVTDHVKAHVHVLNGGTDANGTGKSGFSMGSMYARLRGTNHPQTGMPTFAVLTSPEVDGQYRKELDRVLLGSQPGPLGLANAPFHHAGEEKGEPQSKYRQTPQHSGSLAADMHLTLPSDRFGDRQSLLRQLDGINRQLDATGKMAGFDKYYEQATELVLGGAAKAFDLRQENDKLVRQYDTGHIQVGHKLFRPSTLGKQMLMARRLCEAGCGFVTVHSAGWDMHADGNNPGILKGMEMLGRSLDIAISAFLDDVANRGLSDQILLVITGDFGRTPKVNDRGGRDHWARLCTLAFAGGGLRMGQVVGQSARLADVPATTPYLTADLMATVMHSLLDLGQLRLQSGIPREITRISDEAKPIPELV